MTENYNRVKKTINFHSYENSIYSYSDGVKEFMKKHNVLWLVESLYFNCHFDKEENPRFQIWRYTRTLGSLFLTQCTDGFTGELLNEGEFHNHDLPDTFAIWIFEGQIMFPSDFMQVCL